MSQRVEILKDINYEPSPNDDRLCFGQLAKRASKRRGGKTGPMVHYFPKGRTPVLSDEVAADFIAKGIAKPYDGEPVNASTREAMIAESAVR